MANSNPFFNALGNSGNNPLALLSQLKNNPLALLGRAGFQIPMNINSPQEILQYLMNSGQISQQQMNQAQQMARNFRF